jgi:hypothetical protein
VIWTLLSLVLPAVLLFLYARATAGDSIAAGWVWFGTFLLFVGAFVVWLVGIFLIALAHAIGRHRQQRPQLEDSQSEPPL